MSDPSVLRKNWRFRWKERNDSAFLTFLTWMSSRVTSIARASAYSAPRAAAVSSASRARSFTRPAFERRSEEVAEHDRRLIGARDFHARIPRREADVLVGVGSVDLCADEIPEITEPGGKPYPLDWRIGVAAVGVAANQRQPAAKRQPGERPVLRAEVIRHLRAGDIRERAPEILPGLAGVVDF